MQFGSREFLERLKAGYDSGDRSVFNELCRQAVRYTNSILLKYPYLYKEDKEDIAHNACVKVLTEITTFICNLDMNDGVEARSGAWFKTTIHSEIYDYFRHIYAKKRDRRSEELGDDEYWNEFQCDDDSSPENRGMLLSDCSKYISDICNINASPERIIAFFFNMLWESPTQVAKDLEGVFLYKAAKIAKDIINQNFDICLPSDVYKGLYEKLDKKCIIKLYLARKRTKENIYISIKRKTLENISKLGKLDKVGYKRFYLSKNKISDATNFIRTKMINKYSYKSQERRMLK